MKYKILVVDDEVMLTQLLSDHLQDNGYLVYAANSGREALEKLQVQPDLILLDINMPDMSGLELCKTIRDHVSCPILFLTARITEEDKVNGLMTGGDDYITKPFGLSELTARIAAHLRRETRSKVVSRIIASGELLVDQNKKSVLFEEKEIPLSKREYEIVELLITNSNQVFDRERIYEAIWGYDAEGDSTVIKEHIRKIRAKLMEGTGQDYIETVWGVGYRWKK